LLAAVRWFGHLESFLSQMLMDSVKGEPKSFAFDLQSLISLKCFIFWGESNPFRDYEYV
jgi:hypothetical protein